MKLKDGFILHNAGDEYMAVVSSKVFNGIIRNNETADFIFRQLLSDTTKDEVVDAVMNEYEAERSAVEKDVDKIIEQLRTAGCLDE